MHNRGNSNLTTWISVSKIYILTTCAFLISGKILSTNQTIHNLDTANAN